MKRTFRPIAAPFSAMLLLLVLAACGNLTHSKPDDGKQDSFNQDKKISEAPDMSNDLRPAKPKV